MKKDKQKIFSIINKGSIGDVLVSSSLAFEIKKHYPESKLIFITSPYTKEIVENIPEVDEVFIFDKKGINKGLLGMLRFIFHFKYRFKVDYAFIAHRYFRGTLISFFIGAKRRISDPNTCRIYKFLLTDYVHKNTDLQPHYMVERYADYINYSKNNRYIETQNIMSLKLNENIINSAKYLLNQTSCPKKNLIGLVTNKFWDIDKIEEFINIAYKKNYHILLFGDERYIEISKKLKERNIAGYTDFIAKTSLNQLMGLMTLCCKVVSVDTGSMHIAVALKLPTIALISKESSWAHNGKSLILDPNTSPQNIINCLESYNPPITV